MSTSATAPDEIAPFHRAPPFGPEASVTNILAITHEPGVLRIDRIGIAGALLGEPGGR